MTETWQRYKLAPTLEMRPYVPGEDLTNIDTVRVPHPQVGEMVARDPAKPDEMWIISGRAFSGYSPVKDKPVHPMVPPAVPAKKRK